MANIKEVTEVKINRLPAASALNLVQTMSDTPRLWVEESAIRYQLDDVVLARSKDVNYWEKKDDYPIEWGREYDYIQELTPSRQPDGKMIKYNVLVSLMIPNPIVTEEALQKLEKDLGENGKKGADAYRLAVAKQQRKLFFIEAL